MEFTLIGSFEGKHSTSLELSQNIIPLDKADLSYTWDFMPTILEDVDVLELSTKWVYTINYKGINIFEIDSSETYLITETIIAPADMQLEKITQETYERLSHAFDEKRKVFTFFDTMLNITEDVKQNAIAQLQEVLFHLGEPNVE